MMNAVVDNDVIYKGACYGALGAFLSAIPADASSIGVLGEARYVLPKKVKRANLNGNRELVLEVLKEFFDITQEIETTEEEQKFAAEIELEAQRAHLRLDIGESQLCAVLVFRGVPRLATGDKNAISALAKMSANNLLFSSVFGRVVCLEQIVREVTKLQSWSDIRNAICGEPEVDASLRSVMGCTNPLATLQSILDGLESYIGHLKRVAPKVLCEK